MNRVFELVTTWSKDAIQMTYKVFNPIPDGTVLVCSGAGETYSCSSEDNYRPDQVVERPKEIRFLINGKSYSYKDGPVSPELAAALASAPERNEDIEIVLEDDRTVGMPIGKGTVKAWKKVFGGSDSTSYVPEAKVSFAPLPDSIAKFRFPQTNTFPDPAIFSIDQSNKLPTDNLAGLFEVNCQGGSRLEVTLSLCHNGKLLEEQSNYSTQSPVFSITSLQASTISGCRISEDSLVILCKSWNP